MSGIVPNCPKIYHIVHWESLRAILERKEILCLRSVESLGLGGVSIGMEHLKRKRLTQNTLSSLPGMYVGDFVPFYFCPRSVMLYAIFRNENPYVSYRGGQEPIVHIQSDLFQTVKWAEKNTRRWAITLQNASASYFEDRSSVEALNELNWDAIRAKYWSKLEIKEAKQAEFLLERSFPSNLIEVCGVQSHRTYELVGEMIQELKLEIPVKLKPDWYY